MGRKKKVGIVTILDVANFGSMLQAYALATVMERMGLEVEFINYWRTDYTTSHKVCTFLKDRSLGNILKRVIFAFLALFFYVPIRKRVRSFVTRKFTFTRSYHSIDELLKHPPVFDIVVSGSDQIWNSVYNNGIDRTFYLDFADCPRIAYAASSGMDEFPKEELSKVKKLISRYYAVSVRESQTCDYLHSLGFSHVQHVLDPSLLLDAKEWREIAGCKEYESTKKEKYLLVYSVERFNNDFIFSQAKRIAQELKLKMYVVCTTYPVKAKDYGFDKIYAMASVKTFLRLMVDADFVVVSSFHGTAFALNFNKEFVTISANKYNIRMESLINQFGIAHRIVTTSEKGVFELLPIDYEYVNYQLDIARSFSKSFLQKSLSLNS